MGRRAIALVGAGIVTAPLAGLNESGFPPGTIGVLDVDASRPPAELWRTPIEEGSGWPQTELVGDVAVTFSDHAATGVALTDGEVLWQTPVTAATCQIRARLTCVEQPGSGAATVLRIDPATGAQSEVPLPFASAALDIGDDLLVFTPGDEPSMRYREAGGQTRWETTLDTSEYGTDAESVEIESAGSWAWVGAANGLRAVLDVKTGAILDEYLFLSRTNAGYMVRTASDPAETLVDEQGSVLLDGITAQIDDDVLGPYDLTWDVTAPSFRVVYHGDVLWETDGTGLGPAARVDGVLVMQGANSDGGTTVIARDVVTGTELWVDAYSAGMAAPIGAAGSVLLVSGVGGIVQGYDVHTGEQLWSLQGIGYGELTLLPDGLLLGLGDELIRLGW